MATIKPFRPIQCGTGSPRTPGIQSKTILKQTEHLSGIKEKLKQPPVFQIQEHPSLTTDEYVPMNISALIKSRELEIAEKEGFYVCQMVRAEQTYTSFWALTSFNDFRSGRIKRHELVRPSVIADLKRSRGYTELEGSPVLITYPSSAKIDKLNAQVMLAPPCTEAGDDQVVYRL